jgi:hypothetical protein
MRASPVTQKLGHPRVAILAAKPITFGVARAFESMAEFEETPLTEGPFRARHITNLRRAS